MVNGQKHQRDFIIPTIMEVEPITEQDQERRGPILQVSGPHSEIKLIFLRNDEDDEDNFVCEHLEPFCATARGIDKKSITLKNEGTTGIRCQWLRFPPNQESEFLLANPAGCVIPGGGSYYRRTGSKRRLNSEKVSKPACHQFRFRELPSVLLPGQSLEYNIVFRSTTPGYFYENLYLLTHPKLRDDDGRGYSLRLTGVCINPDFVEEPDSSKIRPGNINDLVNQVTLEQEAKDLLDSILDHALFVEPDYPTTLPYLKVTSESIFYTHNKNLKYYHEISQQSLETVRQLIELLVPLQRIERNETLCTLSIESLYQLLWTRNSSKDLYGTNFKSDEAENLLAKFAGFNNILVQPRRFVYFTAESRKISSSHATLMALMDQILNSMQYIETLYSAPDLQEIFLRISVQKYDTGKLYEKDESSSWDFSILIPPVNKENSKHNLLDENGNLIMESEAGIEDPETDKLPSSQNPTIKSSKKTVTLEKPKKGKSKKDLSKKKGKKSKSKSKTKIDSEPQKGGDNEQNSSSTIKMEEPSTSSLPPGKNEVGRTPDEMNENISRQLSSLPPAVQEQFLEEKKRRIYQAKKMVFEDIFAEGIERILCAVDAFNAMEDYRQSEYYGKQSVSTNYCCSTD